MGLPARVLLPISFLAACSDETATATTDGRRGDASHLPPVSSDAALVDHAAGNHPDVASREASTRDARGSGGARHDSGRDGEARDSGRVGDARRDRDLDTGGGPDVRMDAPIQLPPPFTANFLWRPITFQHAIDLGHHAAPVQADVKVAPGPITLKEVGVTAGLAAAVGGGNQHGMGIGFIDVDGDDYEDIFVANGFWTDNPPTQFPAELYLNRRDGTFVDATKSSGLEAILAGLDLFAVAAADYDADGDFDLYVTTNPRDLLLQNDGSGHFTNVTVAANAGGGPDSSAVSSRTGRSKVASWGDMDGDGWLDIAVASSSFPGFPGNAYLLRNKGDGTFQGVTVASSFAAAPTGNPCAIMWTDYDNDGDQDVHIWNDQGIATENRVLLKNDGNSHFTNVNVAAQLVDTLLNPMGIDGADVDRNGFLDYYVSNIGGNALYLANGDGTFKNVRTEAGVAGNFGWGLGFEDLNADTWPDIFVAQEDAKGDLTFTHQGVVPPKFTVTGWAAAPILYTSWAHNVAVAFADYDKNGAVDVVRATTDGSRVSLFRNDTDLGSQSWLEVRIGRTPRTGEKGGISARVVVKTGDLVQFADIEGGAGKSSSNAISARFGLGQWTGADWVAAIWPDGRELSALNVPGNRTLVLSAQP